MARGGHRTETLSYDEPSKCVSTIIVYSKRFTYFSNIARDRWLKARERNTNWLQRKTSYLSIDFLPYVPQNTLFIKRNKNSTALFKRDIWPTNVRFIVFFFVSEWSSTSFLRALHPGNMSMMFPIVAFADLYKQEWKCALFYLKVRCEQAHNMPSTTARQVLPSKQTWVCHSGNVLYCALQCLVTFLLRRTDQAITFFQFFW